MSSKNQFPVVFNWQTISPITGFLPTPYQTGSVPSGVVSGDMSTTIYSQIIDLSKMDITGLEVTWTGVPVGVFEVYASNSGVNFYALSFAPSLGQPLGSASGYTVQLELYPFKYIMLQYTATSGAGNLTVYGQNKDLN
jgi:hypothetical protein